ncbi:DMT family transporter [Pokkaliibacter sp. CJK22405]|uniref:DMT family transporter n=1 Tax=Pokkaliibacter sp. CJK22405 TaxID=3384615 RepID=UPI0039851FD4
MSAPLPVLRQAPDGKAFAIMIVLCTIWASQTIAIKLAADDIGTVAQVGVRSLGATLLLWAYALWRRERLFVADGSLWPGLLAGFLFAMEFVCVTFGLTLTSATHIAVFLYTSPLWTALGLHFLVPGEQLSKRQWLGMSLAFIGLILALSEGLINAGPVDAKAVLGDLIGLASGFFWGITTVAIRATSLSEASPVKTLMYELGFTACLLIPMAALMGQFSDWNVTFSSTLSMTYQTIILSTLSFVGWLALLRKYLASRLAVFSFMTPIIAAIFGATILGDQLSTTFIVGGVLVLAGIMVVTRRTA